MSEHEGCVHEGWHLGNSDPMGELNGKRQHEKLIYGRPQLCP